MQAKLTHVRLCVDDLAKCFVFYRDVMKLKPRTGSEKPDDVYAEFDMGGDVTLALFKHDLMQQAIGVKHDDTVKTPGERVVLTFFVPSVDAAFAELKEAGATVASEPADQPAWMIRVAHFRDPAGNLLEMHEPLSGTKA